MLEDKTSCFICLHREHADSPREAAQELSSAESSHPLEMNVSDLVQRHTA